MVIPWVLSWGQWGPIGSKKWVKTVNNYHAPKLEYSTTPRSSIFRKKWKLRLWQQITVGTPRVHLGVNRFLAKIGSYDYGAKSWWGPPRVHLVDNGVALGPKNGSKPQKITMPQKSNFRLPHAHRFIAKNGIYGYDAKSRWGSRGVYLGANGVPLGPKKWVKTIQNYHAPKFKFSTTQRSSIFPKKWKLRLWCQIMVGTHWVQSWGQWGPIGLKNGSKPSKITMPKNLHFQLPRGHRFFVKNGIYGYGAKSRWGPHRVHLGANGVPLGKKMGQNRRKLLCAKIRIFDYPAVIDFLWKTEVTVMATNHGGDPIGSILGPMGSHWVQKMGQNRKKLPCPKMRIFDYPAVIEFLQKMEVTVMAPSHGGDPLGSILGPMGSPWVKKNGSKPYKITMPQNSNFRLPRDHRFFPKNGSYDYGDKSRWGLPRVHHGANGSHWVHKIGQKRRKLPCPKIRIFDYPPVTDFLQKMEVTVMVPNHLGDPVGSILRPMGSH